MDFTKSIMDRKFNKVEEKAKVVLQEILDIRDSTSLHVPLWVFVDNLEFLVLDDNTEEGEASSALPKGLSYVELQTFTESLISIKTIIDSFNLHILELTSMLMLLRNWSKTTRDEYNK